MKHLSEIVDHVVRHVSFYQGMAKRDFVSLPVLSRAELKEQVPALISQEDLASYENVADALGGRVEFATDSIEVDTGQGFVVERTSGSTGVPLLCAKTKRERLLLGLLAWRRRLQTDPQLTPSGYSAFNHFGGSTPRYDYYDFSPENVQRIYGYIQRNSIRWIHFQAWALLAHIEILREVGWSSKTHFDALRFIECNGHYLHVDERAEIEEFFDCQVIDHYGTIETWTIGLECADGRLHTVDGAVHLEILDPHGCPCPVGDPGRVVVTSKVLRLLPIVRYDTGDIGRLGNEECSCGISDKVLTLEPAGNLDRISGSQPALLGGSEFPLLVKEVGESLDLSGLLFYHIVQERMNRFRVTTNPFEGSNDFIIRLKEKTEELLCRPLDMLHVEVNSDSRVRALKNEPLFRSTVR